jgi:hypothetical protein
MSSIQMFLFPLTTEFLYKLGCTEWKRIFGSVSADKIIAFEGGVMSRKIAPLGKCKQFVWITKNSNSKSMKPIPLLFARGKDIEQVMKVIPIYPTRAESRTFDKEFIYVDEKVLAAKKIEKDSGWQTLTAEKLVEAILNY